MRNFAKDSLLLLFGLLFCVINLKAEVDMYYYDSDGLVNITFTPRSFFDPPGDVDDPLGCVFVDNLFLARFSPEQIEDGHFAYIDNPEMNEYIRGILNDLGVCSVYVFIEGMGSGGEHTDYSEAAKFDIEGDNYERLGSAQVWQKLENYVQEKFDTLRDARHIIETNNWNFKADLTFGNMLDPLFPSNFPLRGGEGICEPCSSPEPTEFDGEEGIIGVYSGIDLPPSFDWRNKGGENWMTSAKNQYYVGRDVVAGVFEGAYCGSCWITGTLGAVEAFYNIEMDDPDFDLDLSEQHVICKTRCGPGVVDDAYIILVNQGVVTEDCLPHVANGTSCDLCEDWESQLVKLNGFRTIYRSSGDLETWRNIIKENLLETPLTFCLSYTNNEIYKLTYAAYSGGIFPLWHGGYSHCVVLVGWGNNGGEDYWIVKNSLGPNWGENGYLKMKMADNYDNSIEKFYKPIIRRPKVGIIAANPNTSSAWHSLSFSLANPRFVDPIVVMGPPSYEANKPITVRVKDVTPQGFKFQLDEWDYQDGIHGAEIIPYLVVEKGARVFDDLKYEAGKIEDFSNDFFNDWRTVELKDGFFSEPPIILTQVVTRNGEEAVVTRIRNVSASSFEIMLQEEEANDGIHVAETVHYIAISPGSGRIGEKDFVASKTPNSVTHNWHTIDFNQSLSAPLVIANMNTTNGPDPCALRYRNPTNSSVEVKVEEEQSDDPEVNHVSEAVGYIAISDVGIGTARPEAPSDFETGFVTLTSIYLLWQHVASSEASFVVERKEGSGSFSQIGIVSWPAYTDYGLNPGTTYTYQVRAYNYGGYSDYSEEFSVTTLYPFDFATISEDQLSSSLWHQVDLPMVFYHEYKYKDPIVVMGPPSCEDDEPTTIRVKEVSPEIFKFQIDEWDYYDGSHGNETIHYMVMEEGVHEFDGEIWEAGKIEGLNLGSSSEFWKTVNFKSDGFDEPPVVLAQVVTYEENSAVVTRIRNVTTNSFEIRLQEQEVNAEIHVGETVHYIATEEKSGELGGRKLLVGKTGNNVTHQWNNEIWSYGVGTIELPIFLAGMQTFDGPDPCALRYQNLTETSVEIKCDEERSKDTEVNHTTEEVGYLVISGAEPAPSTFTTSEKKEIYDNYIKLASPVVSGNIVLNVSSNSDRKATIELIDIAGRVIKRKDLKLKRGREDLNLGQFRSGVYFIRIHSDEENKPEVHKITVLR